jgi:hypothetical protein
MQCIPYASLLMKNASLADGTSVRILGVTKFLDFKVSCYCFKQQFLIFDMDAYDCLLGMSFLLQVNPDIDWVARTMHVMHKGIRITSHAVGDNHLRVLNSKRFEWCSFDVISLDSAGTEPLLPGPRGLQPDVKAMLLDFKDVLVTETPGGLPPERCAADDIRIEHRVNTAPDVTQYARPRRPFTAHENAEIQRYLLSCWLNVG